VAVIKRRWWTGLVSAVLVAVTLLGLPGASSAGSAGLTAVKAGTRAMWVWGDYPATEVVAWAASKGVTEIFVYVSPNALTNGDLARLQQMRQLADGVRIKLSALGGEPAWTTDHAAALAWLRTVVATGIFSGVHLDVEPYLTSGWTSKPAATEQAYLSLLDEMRAGSTLPLEADVPFWFGQYKVGSKNLADEVLKRVKAVTVMSYRDTATGSNSMVAISQDWLARGAAAGKRVRLGAETGPLPECAYCTFAQEGGTKMTQVLAKVDTATKANGAYGGVAIHRYGAWRALKS
jgi:hypothetical protein